MSASISRLSYTDIFDLLERAMENDKGIRVRFSKHEDIIANRSDAFQARIRVNNARQIDRADNRKQYDPNSPLYGRSRYDILCARVKQIDGEVFMYLEKRNVLDFDVEDLAIPYSEMETIEGMAQSDQLLLEGKGESHG